MTDSPKAFGGTVVSGDLYLSGFYLDPEHVKSPILRKDTANQFDVSTTPVTSAASSQSSLTDQDLRDSMPTYQKVGKFLLKVLATELKSGRDAPEFRPYRSAEAVLAAFKAQFEAFTRQYPPYSARAAAWTKPYLYWTAMGEQSDASILAFVALKVYSILPNSMPEERTVSRFTRMNTNDRASQDASTIVGMTKIYQHNRREDRGLFFYPRQDAPLSKPPTLNWRSVKLLMTPAPKDPSPMDTAAAPNPDDPLSAAQVTEDCEAGLEAVNEANETSQPGSLLPGSLVFDIELDGVDISMPFFRDCLSDVPVDGADNIKSLSTWAVTSGKKGSKSAQPAPTMKFGGKVEELNF
ncbi:hypothetical protein FB451DRAFT_1191822 [Mycena latifolia]|nr:hypothetical protein FB451DRAFT_1191822 [Mycena latifolia]